MTTTFAERYLALLKKSLLNELYIENQARLVYIITTGLSGQPIDGNVIRDIVQCRPEIVNHLRRALATGTGGTSWQISKPDGATVAADLRDVLQFEHIMTGRPGLDNIHQLLDIVIRDNVPGDLIETGVWRGGATIFMRGYLAAHGIDHRRVWVADSFAGLPKPSERDGGLDLSPDVHPILAVSRADVEELFSRYELLDDRVRFLEGWFKDTLPAAPIDSLALMRLDGDLYESTRDALVNLYPRLSPGGFVIVDDYGDIASCRAAVDEFRAENRIFAPIQQIDWTRVFWRKPTE